MSRDVSLKYKTIWLILGCLMIAVIMQQTLTPSPVTGGIQLSDKLAHIIGYFTLMGWFVQIYHSAGEKIFWGLFFIALGILLEYLQGLGGVRQYEVADMGANALGVICAWLLSYTGFSCMLARFERLLNRT